MTTNGNGPAMAPQGDLRLLETDMAKHLLSSAIPARLAYIAADGTPRVIATWFHWTGTELVMPTFISAPHIRRPAARIAALRAHPDVAITIDTESFPPMVLSVRGRAALTEVDGVDAQYRLAARRYLGEEAAAVYLAQIDQPVTKMMRIAVKPAWVGVLDFQQRLPAAMGGPGGSTPRTGVGERAAPEGNA
jgi:hypothetical protein